MCFKFLHENINIFTGYRENPYHNSTHAADVTQTVHFFMAKGNLRAKMSDLEIMGLIISAIVHDYDHPVCCKMR